MDLLHFLAGNKIISSNIARMKANTDDTVTISLTFQDGALGTIHYSQTAERLEVFASGKILQMDSFKMMKGYGWKGFRKMNLWSQDKGHSSEVKAFVEAVANGGPGPIPFDEIVEVSETTLRLGVGS